MRNPVTVVAFGDSTTAPREGVTAYPELLQQRWAKRPLPVQVINAGVRGDHTQRAVARIALDVLAHAPRVVVVRFGINDAAVDVWASPPATVPRVPLAQFCRNMTTMVEAIRSVDAVPVLCTPNPLAWSEATQELYGKPPYQRGDADGFNVLLRDYVAAIHALATELHTPLVDLDAAFRQVASKVNPPWQTLLSDGMHPNDAGHALAAKLLAPVIDAILAA
jgi:lysophospholipase L1-like esterase